MEGLNKRHLLDLAAVGKMNYTGAKANDGNIIRKFTVV